MIDSASFVRIWERWDEVMEAMPKHAGPRYGERETNAMETACQEISAEIGIPCCQFRREIIAAGREGMGRTQAIEHVRSAAR